MAEYTIDKFSYGGNTYKLQDNVSGYTSNTGTVTSVGISNATNGGLSVSSSPITGSGSITVGHSNVLTSAQTTQAVYPITIDKNGHIASYGEAYVPSGSTYIVDTSEQVNWPEVVEAYNQGKVIIAQHAYPSQDPSFYNLVFLSYDNPQNPSGNDYMVFTVAKPQLNLINNFQFKSGRIDSLMWSGATGTWNVGSTELVSSYDGVVNSDLTFMAPGNIGEATPALRFQRVTLTDSHSDWQMYGDDSDNLVVQQKTGNNAWATEATLTPSGNLTVPSVSLTTGTISTTPNSSTDIVNKSYVDARMTVVTFTPNQTTNNLIISVQQPSSITNGNEVSY